MPARDFNFQIQVLGSAFYRNKAAYIIGKAINGPTEYPFAIPVLHDQAGQLYLDTILLDAWRIGLLFSLSRAYFMVNMEVPSGYVQFLRAIMPNFSRIAINSFCLLSINSACVRISCAALRRSESSPAGFALFR